MTKIVCIILQYIWWLFFLKGGGGGFILIEIPAIKMIAGISFFMVSSSNLKYETYDS